MEGSEAQGSLPIITTRTSPGSTSLSWPRNLPFKWAVSLHLDQAFRLSSTFWKLRILSSLVSGAEKTYIWPSRRCIPGNTRTEMQWCPQRDLICQILLCRMFFILIWCISSRFFFFSSRRGIAAFIIFLLSVRAFVLPSVYIRPY